MFGFVCVSVHKQEHCCYFKAIWYIVHSVSICVYCSGQLLFNAVHPLLCSQVCVRVCNQYWMANTERERCQSTLMCVWEREVLKHTRSHKRLSFRRATASSSQCDGTNIVAENLKLIHGIYIKSLNIF